MIPHLRTAALLLLLCSLAAAQEIRIETVAARITAIEGDEAVIDLGTDDGVPNGRSCTVLAANGRNLEDPDLGKAKVVAVEARTARVKLEGKNVEVGDFVEVKAAVPARERSPLWTFARRRFTFRYADKTEPPIGYRQLFRDESPALATAIYDAMAVRVKAKQADVLSFLRYLADFEWQLTGRSATFEPAFANWVKQGRPICAAELEERLIAAGTDDDRRKLYETFHVDAPGMDEVVPNLRRRATDLADEKNFEGARAHLAAAAVGAEVLKLAREQAWVLFAHAYVLGEEGKGDAKLTAYAEALAAFRALEPPDKQGEAVCHNNVAVELKERKEFAKSRDAYVAAEEAYRLHTEDAGTRAQAAYRVAEAHTRLNESAKAEAAFARAAVHYRAAKDDGQLFETLRQRGDLLMRMKRFDDATALYAEFLEIARRVDHWMGESMALERMAWIHVRARRFAKAIPLYERALAVHRKRRVDTLIGGTLDKLARVHYDAGDWVKSYELHKEALAVRRKTGVTNAIAKSLQAVADLDLKFGHSKKALAHCEEALAILRRHRNDAGVALVLVDIGHIHNVRYAYEAALKAYDESVALYRAGTDRKGLAFALRNRGVAHQRRRDFEPAMADYREALEIRRELKLERESIDSLTAVARCLWDQGKYDDAMKMVGDAIEGARKLKDLELEALCLQTQGHLHKQFGKYSDAGKCFSAAKDLYDRLDDLPNQLRAFHESATVYLETGMFAFAINLEEVVLDGARTFNDTPLAIESLLVHARSFRMLGQLKDAAKHVEEALKLAGGIQDEGLQSDVFLEQAELASALGRNADALAAYDKALALHERARYQWGIAKVLARRSRELHRQGARDRALEDSMKALDFAGDVNDWMLIAEICSYQAELLIDENRLEIAIRTAGVGVWAGKRTQQRDKRVRNLVLRGRARGYRGIRLNRKGKRDEARALLTQAGADFDDARKMAVEMEARLLIAEVDLEAAEILMNFGANARPLLDRALGHAQGSAARHLLWRIHYDLSLIDARAGNLGKALEHRRESVRVLEEIRTALGGGAAAQEKFLRNRIRIYESLVDLLGKLIEKEKDAAQRKKYIDEAMELVARARFERLARNMEGTGSKKLDELLAKYRQAERDRARQREQQVEALAAGNKSRAKSIGTVLAKTEERLAELFTDLKAQDKDLGARLRFDPRRIGEAMFDAPDGATLVVYFPGERNLLLWVFTNDGFKEWRQVAISRTDLYAHVKRYRDLIAEVVERVGNREPMGKGFGPEAEADEANPEWYRKNITATREVLARLHGHLLAPIAKHVAGAEPLLILPYGQLSYLPFEALVDGNGAFVGATKRLAYFTSEHHLADALRGLRTEPKRGDDVWVAFADPRGRLTSSLEEAGEIKGLFKTAEVHSSETGTAGEEQVLGVREDCTILHFATHGFLNGDKPSRTYLEMDPKSGDGKLAQGEIWPRLRRKAAPFRKRNVRLVVLSACETARAQDDPQAEVLGMPDAFVMAGAPTVVASLWSVYTYTTTDLMIEFYGRLIKQKQDPATALRGARQALLTARKGRYAHPFYWAPFLLFGDWR